MRVLAIDSSGLTATVAVVEDTQTIAEYSIHYKKTHSQTLLPMIDEMFRMVELDINSIDAIAISGGPGSFTGLRIGSATAKGLGLALNKPLIHIPTVDGLAYGVYGCRDLICPIMDARRNQVYTGIYTFSQEESLEEDLTQPKFTVLKSQVAISVEELLQELNERGRQVVFLGDGVPVYQKIIKENLKVPYYFAPSYMNRQRAAVVGALGIQYYELGKYETAAEHEPDYLRVSQAEREREERERNNQVIIREMKIEDTAFVSEMECQIFSDAWSEKSVQETMENPNSVCIVAEKAGHLLGYLLAYHVLDEVEIARIAVEKEARNQGVATKLVEQLKEISKEKNAKKILLDVRKNNDVAIKFYKQTAFAEDGIRSDFYRNPIEDAVLMSCVI